MDQNILDIDVGTSAEPEMPDPFDLISLEPEAAASPPPFSQQYPSHDKIQRFEEFIEDKDLSLQSSSKNARCWELSYYSEYFDVNTSLVLHRLK
jgi:hypothetical protein